MEPRKTRKRKYLNPRRKRKSLRRKKMIPRSQVRNQWKCRLNLRKRIHLTLFLKEPLTWKIGKDSTLTMMRIRAANTFGPSLTPHVTLSGEGTIGITRSSVRSSCLATSWEECSRGWRSSRKTHSHLPCSLARTTIAPSLLFGFFKGQQLAFDLNEDWQVDYSSYEWKKL